MDENVHELIEQRFEKMVKEVHGNCTDAFYAIKEFNAYVTFLEEQLETPIKIISVGPDRAQTIERYMEE